MRRTAGLSFGHLKDLRILNQLSEIYYQNTGMVISFHWPGDDGRIDFYPQDQRSDYCRIIQSTEEGLQRCLACGRGGLAAARRKGSFHIYDCHAGLVDAAIPLDCQGAQIGSIYTGQVLLEEPSLQRALALYGRLGPPGGTLRALRRGLLAGQGGGARPPAVLQQAPAPDGQPYHPHGERKEIVFRTGFKDYNYFNRTIHRLAGMAPAGYRSRHSRAGAAGGGRARPRRAEAPSARRPPRPKGAAEGRS